VWKYKGKESIKEGWEGAFPSLPSKAHLVFSMEWNSMYGYPSPLGCLRPLAGVYPHGGQNYENF